MRDNWWYSTQEDGGDVDQNKQGPEGIAYIRVRIKEPADLGWTFPETPKFTVGDPGERGQYIGLTRYKGDGKEEPEPLEFEGEGFFIKSYPNKLYSATDFGSINLDGCWTPKDMEPTPTPGIPMLLYCPECGTRHLDEGKWATKPHHTHACQNCGVVWRPAVVDTVGVRFLPGFKNDD